VLLLLLAPFVPVAATHRTWRGAVLLAGVPWLVFFAARSLTQIGHFTAYWSTTGSRTQVAGRIYMNGYWLEAGSKVFDYQPLYRWISGALHLIFGDSSVGEEYWDALCLLGGGMLAFTVVAPRGGFRLAVAAASITLGLFGIGTIWYFVGRGLSEVSAAGFAFAASLCLLGAGPTGGSRHRGAAGHPDVLHTVESSRVRRRPGRAPVPDRPRVCLRQVKSAPWRILAGPATAYLATFASAWRCSRFARGGIRESSACSRTSLKNNDIGLRPSTMASPQSGRGSGSLSALVWMNEPPHPDVRAVVVVVGVGVALLALFQVPRIKELPLALALVVAGSLASSLVTHTHNYPGRMSIHLVPFAVAMAFAATGLLRTARLDLPSSNALSA
jgi:hypothetical protein